MSVAKARLWFTLHLGGNRDSRSIFQNLLTRLASPVSSTQQNKKTYHIAVTRRVATLQGFPNVIYVKPLGHDSHAERIRGLPLEFISAEILTPQM